MSDLRQAAQQALEALETCSEDEWHSDDDFGMMQSYDEEKVTQAITALRAALAEPDSDYERGFVDGMNLQTKGSVDKAVNRMAQNPFGDDAERYARKLREEREYYKALFAEHKPEQEPVARAWQEGYNQGIEDERISEANIGIFGFGAKVEPARQNPYKTTAPTPRKPEQEPVAWIQKTAVDWLTTTSSNAYIITTVMKNTNDEAYVPLFTAPTPRRPLTDEEIDRITDQQWGQDNHKPIYAAHRAYARAIEAKLKEKNT